VVEKKFISVQAVAERWGMSYPAVRDVIAKGKLPAARLGGKRYRIDVADVEAYEAAMKREGA
jgi:excisionase family DNA binding protein